MAKYRKSPHTVYELKYHFVWVTKYRYCMLEGEVKNYLQTLINRICDGMSIIIEAGDIGKEHIHMCLSVPPKYSPADVMKTIKGVTSERLFREFPDIRKQYWGKHFWARGYFVSSVGIDEATIKKYIENQREEIVENQMKLWE